MRRRSKEWKVMNTARKYGRERKERPAGDRLNKQKQLICQDIEEQRNDQLLSNEYKTKVR